MGIPSWIWFVVAVVAIALGIALLIADRSQRTANNKERRRWAALRGWQFAETDRVLPTRWERGALAQHSGAEATDVVAGSTFTAGGRRQVYVLDLQVGGRTADVLVAVRCRRPVAVTAELWLPEVPVPQESGLDLLGPVGSRYAFVGDVAASRRLVTSPVAEAADALGSDVTVVWLEGDWVLAALDPAQSEPSRVERLLRDLGELADLVDPFEQDPNEPGVPRDEDPVPADEISEEELLAEADDEVAAVEPTEGAASNGAAPERERSRKVDE